MIACNECGHSITCENCGYYPLDRVDEETSLLKAKLKEVTDAYESDSMFYAGDKEAQASARKMVESARGLIDG